MNNERKIVRGKWMKENGKENEKGNLKKEKNMIKIIEILCIISLIITIFSI